MRTDYIETKVRFVEDDVDINDDGFVDLLDLAVFAMDWLLNK